MRIPVMRGLIDRRILVNYRVDPAVMTKILPPPFRPQVVGGHAIGGICLIRLAQLRPRFVPAFLGFQTENAAHRVAVQWGKAEGVASGVYIPRRDTDSMLATLAGGRIFPGMHHHARFKVEEDVRQVRVVMKSDDGEVRVRVAGHYTTSWPDDSVFASAEEASAFFERGLLGYSATREVGRFDGLELRCRRWEVTPLAVEEVASSFFEDRALFPEGSAVFDNALLMRGIEHEWHSRETLFCRETGPEMSSLFAATYRGMVLDAASFRMTREQLIEEIREAFADVERGEGTTLREARVMDGYGTEEEQKKAREQDTDRHWWEIPREVLEEHGDVHPFLNAEGFRYYLPAFLTWSLKYADRSPSALGDLTIYQLNGWTRKETVACALNDRQARVVARYLLFMAEQPMERGWCDGDAAAKAIRLYWNRHLA